MQLRLAPESRLPLSSSMLCFPIVKSDGSWTKLRREDDLVFELNPSLFILTSRSPESAKLQTPRKGRINTTHLARIKPSKSSPRTETEHPTDTSSREGFPDSLPTQQTSCVGYRWSTSTSASQATRSTPPSPAPPSALTCAEGKPQSWPPRKTSVRHALAGVDWRSKRTRSARRLLRWRLSSRLRSGAKQSRDSPRSSERLQRSERLWNERGGTGSFKSTCQVVTGSGCPSSSIRPGGRMATSKTRSCRHSNDKCSRKRGTLRSTSCQASGLEDHVQLARKRIRHDLKTTRQVNRRASGLCGCSIAFKVKMTANLHS